MRPARNGHHGVRLPLRPGGRHGRGRPTASTPTRAALGVDSNLAPGRRPRGASRSGGACWSSRARDQRSGGHPAAVNAQRTASQRAVDAHRSTVGPAAVSATAAHDRARVRCSVSGEPQPGKLSCWHLGGFPADAPMVVWGRGWGLRSMGHCPAGCLDHHRQHLRRVPGFDNRTTNPMGDHFQCLPFGTDGPHHLGLRAGPQPFGVLQLPGGHHQPAGSYLRSLVVVEQHRTNP